MIYCEPCGTTFPSETVRCTRCGQSLIRAESLTGAFGFNPVLNQRIHQKHRYLNLKLCLIYSSALQMLAMWQLANMTHIGHLFVQALVATGSVLLLHKTRAGALRTICGMFLASGVAGYFLGYLSLNRVIGYLFALWLLTFWYAFLGHQIKLNNDLHA